MFPDRADGATEDLRYSFGPNAGRMMIRPYDGQAGKGEGVKGVKGAKGVKGVKGGGRSFECLVLRFEYAACGRVSSDKRQV